MTRIATFAQRLAATRCLANLASGLTDVSHGSSLGTLDEVTACPPEPDSWSSGGPSGLNHDGAPAQLCVGVSEEAPRVRFIGDPGSHIDEPVERWNAVRTAVQTLGETGAFGRTLLHSFEALCGGSDEWKAQYNLGPCWLAATLGQRGWALYTDTSLLTTAQASERLGMVLELAQADVRPMREFLNRIDGRMWVCSAGIEGDAPSRYRAKLHLRFLKVPEPGELSRAIPIVNDPLILEGIRRTLLDSHLDVFGFVIGVGFNSIDGRMSDAKIDISVSQLGLPSRLVTERLTAAASALGFDVPDALTDALARTVRLSHLGFGRDVKGRRRMNIYVKPVCHSHGEVNHVG